MHKEIGVFDKEISNSKLLALFNTLADSDKDIVIKMAELLVQKWKLKIKNNVDNNKGVLYEKDCGKNRYDFGSGNTR